MREIAAETADLADLLAAVERGESLTITRDGQPIADIIPNEALEAARRKAAVDALVEFRKDLPPTGITVEEILAWRHEGHKY